MIEIKDYDFQGIPFTIYNYKDQKIKPLIFFFHGFTSDRNKGIMNRGELLAQKGYYVVAIDAYLHGERREDNYDELPIELKWKAFFNIVIRTAEDALLLYEEYLSNLSEIKKDKIYAMGVSMGASVAFYLATIMDKLKTIVSIVGSPSFVDFYKYIQSVYQFEKDELFNESLIDYQKKCPLLNYRKLINKKIYMGCGIKDKIVPATYACELSAMLPSENVMCKFYDTEHLSTKEMHDDAYQFLSQN